MPVTFTVNWNLLLAICKMKRHTEPEWKHENKEKNTSSIGEWTGFDLIFLFLYARQIFLALPQVWLTKHMWPLCANQFFVKENWQKCFRCKGQIVNNERSCACIKCHVFVAFIRDIQYSIYSSFHGVSYTHWNWKIHCISNSEQFKPQ